MTTLLVRHPGAATPLPPGTAAGSPARTGAAHVVRWVVRGIVALAVLAFAGLAVGPHVFGYRTLTMLTGSMAPAIDPGDVAVVTPLAVSEVTKGMVITYHIPVEDHRLVTHRVVSVEHGPDGRRRRHRLDRPRPHLIPGRRERLAGDDHHEGRRAADRRRAHADLQQGVDEPDRDLGEEHDAPDRGLRRHRDLQRRRRVDR